MNGRIAVVTGASAGIGEAMAEVLVEAGARVVVNARREDRLRALVDRLGGDDRVAVAAGDTADASVVERMLDTARERFGAEADAVIVNAGRGLKGSLFDSDESQWEEVIRTNLLGASRLMRSAARRMVESGAEPGEDGAWLDRPRDIVVLGSVVGRHISPFSSMYGGTKFAVASLAEALRREVGPRGVRVTLVEPAVVESEFQAGAGYDPVTFGEFMRSIGPVLSPMDVARAMLFVLSQPAGVHVAGVLVRPTRQGYP